MSTTIKKRLGEAVEFSHKFEKENKPSKGNDNEKINSRFAIGKETEHHVGDEDGIYCIDIHPQLNRVVTGLGSGLMHVYDSEKMTRIRKVRTGLITNLPLLAVKFHPCIAKDLLFTGGSNGVLQIWNMENYNVVHSAEEISNQIMSIDFTGDGLSVASVGKDSCVRIYDSSTLAINRCYPGTKTLDINTVGSDMSVPGHSGKILAVKFHPDDRNMLVTASWDRTLKVWDMRLDSAVRTIYGPNVCGDGLDINHNSILTASWKANEALQIWDYRMESLISTLTFPLNGSGKKGEYLYCGRFWDEGHVLAGGSGTKDLKVINIQANKVVGAVSGNSHPVQACEVNTKAKLMFCGTSGNLLKKVEINE